MGRPNKIHSPEMMWELFEEYKRYTKNNPILKHTFVGKEGRSEYSELERPLTMEGFDCYCMDKGVIHGLENYFANTNRRYSKFSSICSRIRREIRQDQISGGMAGIYNPSITQRLNNLVDKVEQTIIEQPLFNEGQEEEQD
jgi:hypothetical protein